MRVTFVCDVRITVDTLWPFKCPVTRMKKTSGSFD